MYPNVPNGPLLPDSVNFVANSTISLKSNKIISNIISDSVATLTGGILSNVNYPIDDNDVATKLYVDTLPRSQPDGPQNLSIQTNGGSGHFMGYLNLLFNNGLTLFGTFTNNQIIIDTDNRVSGLTNPTNQYDAANKQYVQSTNLSIINKETTGISQTTTLLPSEIINKIMKREIKTTGTLDQDILPRAKDIIDSIPGAIVGSSFSFYYHYTTKKTSKYKVLILYGNTERTNILQKGNYFYINTPDNLLNVFPETIIEFQGSVISVDIPEVSMYVISSCSLYADNAEQITKEGLQTKIFNSINNELYNNSYVIYPLIRKVINTSASYTYTVSDVKSLLLVRRGLTSNTIDEFAPSSDFMLGTGSIKMVIQNIDPVYSITIGSNTTSGWSFASGSRTISPQKNGLFYIYIDTDLTTCQLVPYGIVDRNGL